jgi:hypothetical protein
MTSPTTPPRRLVSVHGRRTPQGPSGPSPITSAPTASAVSSPRCPGSTTSLTALVATAAGTPPAVTSTPNLLERLRHAEVTSHFGPGESASTPLPVAPPPPRAPVAHSASQTALPPEVQQRRVHDAVMFRYQNSVRRITQPRVQPSRHPRRQGGDVVIPNQRLSRTTRGERVDWEGILAKSATLLSLSHVRSRQLRRLLRRANAARQAVPIPEWQAQRGVVYAAFHTKSSKFYVGETGNTIAVRLKQHWSNRSSRQRTGLSEFMFMNEENPTKFVSSSSPPNATLADARTSSRTSSPSSVRLASAAGTASTGSFRTVLGVCVTAMSLSDRPATSLSRRPPVATLLRQSNTLLVSATTIASRRWRRCPSGHCNGSAEVSRAPRLSAWQ